MGYINTYVSISGQIIKKTDKALFFSPVIQDGSFLPAQWLPRSQCLSIQESYDEIEGVFDILMASEWILGQKSWMQVARDQKNPPPKKDSSLSNPPDNDFVMDDEIPF